MKSSISSRIRQLERSRRRLTALTGHDNAKPPTNREQIQELREILSRMCTDPDQRPEYDALIKGVIVFRGVTKPIQSLSGFRSR